ncbi:MAG: hypothetical protein AAF566_01190 [Pseudomonadota bacterium]
MDEPTRELASGHKSIQPEMCWKELLQGSLDGLTHGGSALETLLDRLERAS